MNETGHPREDTGPSQLDDARLGFQVAERRAALASQEIYSRFGAMLTAHSIIIAILGWTLTSEHRLPPVLGVALPVVGLLLCVIWLLFNVHGLYYQGLFMREALRLETKFFGGVFSIFQQIHHREWHCSWRRSEGSTNGLQTPPRIIRWFPYKCTSTIVIVLFVVIYGVVLYVTINKLCT